MSGFKMDDYVDVAERIRQFAERFPEGSLQSELERQEGGWLCKAYAYRSPTDERPGIGHAFEPVPGKTPYTKDSEAMNSETSAWGRAIVALGFDTKKIASAQEIKAREADPNGFAASRADAEPLNDHAQVRVHFGKNVNELVADLPKKSREWYAGDGWAEKKAESDRPVTPEDMRLRRAARVLSGLPIDEKDGPFISDDEIPF